MRISVIKLVLTIDRYTVLLQYYTILYYTIVDYNVTYIWWECNEAKLPNWASTFRKLILVQPSSAAVERVFSLLSNSFSKHQTSSLEDYVQISVMLQFNNR